MTLSVGGFATLIQVLDMPASLAFYRDILGFEAISDVPPDGRCDWVWLKSGESELMLNTAYEAHERPSTPERGRVAGHSDVTLFFACDDVDAAYAELRAHDVDVKEPTITHYGMKVVTFTDPDGYEMCLQQPLETAKGSD